MGVYRVANNGAVYSETESVPAGVSVVMTMNLYDTRTSGGGGSSTPAPTNPDPVPNPDSGVLGLLTAAERTPTSGSTAWEAQKPTTSVSASSGGWLVQSSDTAVASRVGVAREPFAVESGTVTFEVTPADGSQGRFTAGVDWFGPGSTYMVSSFGASGSGSVTAARPAGATMGKPWVQADGGSPATFKAAKMTLLPGTTPAPTPAPTPPSGSLAAGGSLYTHYKEIWGSSLLCEPIPADFPRARPADPYWAGREIKRQATPSQGFYAPTMNIDNYAFNVYVVDSRLPEYAKKRVRHRNGRGFGSVDWSTGKGIDINNYLMVPMRGDEPPSPGTDGACTFYDVATGELWELWQYEPNDPAGRSCEWMGYAAKPAAKWDVRFDVGSVTASGLHGSPLQIGIDEARAGVIDHAIGLELPIPGGAYNDFSWPAKQSDGFGGNNTAVEGQILILDPAYNVASLPTKFQRMVGLAVQKYGFLVTDKSGCVAARGEPQVAWMRQNNTTTNPWPAILENKPYWQVWDGFPWDKLIAVQRDYRKR